VSLVWRPLDKDVVNAWSELTNLLAVVDHTDEIYEPEHLAEELDEPGSEPESNTRGVWDGDRLIGYAQLRDRTVLPRDGTRTTRRTAGRARTSCRTAATGAVRGAPSTNPTGAGALYESVGFGPTKTFAAYGKEVPAALG
jgi:hypothetical protein